MRYIITLLLLCSNIAWAERDHVVVPTDIHCFKYNARSCDFEIFKDQFEASDYILEPLPTVYYEVTVQDE